MKNIIIVPYRAEWPNQFQAVGARLRDALRRWKPGIHHIGSTAVRELAAKDILDIQLSVNDFDRPMIAALEAIGFKKKDDIIQDHRPPGRDDLDELNLSKWLFKGHDPLVHLHVRLRGTFNERYPLLCRDFLRANPLAAKAYELIKINLAARFPHDADAYYDIKDPVFDVLMAGAELWATQTGWTTPTTDID